MAFPTTSILDTFDRANEGPPPSANWSSAIGALGGGFKVVSNACAVDGLGVAGAASDYWNVSTFPANCEAYFTITTLPTDTNSVQLFARGQQLGDLTADAYSVAIERDDTLGDTVAIVRLDNATGTVLGTPVSVTFQVGDSIGIELVGSSIRSKYKPVGGSWSQLDSQTDGTYTGTGYIGIIADNTAVVINDFGGGAIVYNASLSKQTVRITTGATTASKAKSAISSPAKQTVRVITNTVTASRNKYTTATLTKPVISVIANNLTVSKVVSKTATTTIALISVTTNATTASSGGTPADNKTASTIQQLISIITNSTVGSKSVVKSSNLSKSLVSVVVNSVTCSKGQNKTASLTKQVVSVITNTTTAGLGVDSKTSSLTKQVIQIVTNNLSCSKSVTKSASTTKAEIRLLTNTLSVSSTLETSNIRLTALGRSRIKPFINSDDLEAVK